MNVSMWCTRVIRWSFYLLFILIPLFLTPINYELFEFNKMMATYAITVVIVTAWVVSMIHERKIRIARTPLDIPIALFFVSQLVATLFSIDPHTSWIGYYSRFNGGMWSVISYILLYYAYVSNMPELSQLVRIMLGSAVVVSLYGVAEHFGIDKHLWVQDVQNRIFSTLGQPNWLAAYIVALFPLSIALGLQSITPGTEFRKIFKFTIPLRVRFWMWNAIALLFFFILLFTRSRSGLFGFLVAGVVLWVILFLQTQNKKQLLPAFAILHGVFALVIFFNGSNIAQLDKYFTLGGLRQTIIEKRTQKQEAAAPEVYTAPALESGGTESGTIRKYVWQAAVTAWRSSTKVFLIGTGTETFAFTFYRFRPTGHNMTSEWDFLYNKAHNEYLNYLATTGIFGLGSYLVFLGTCIFLFIRRLRTVDPHQSALPAAFFAGWVSILATNFFGFSVVIMQLFLFLFPAFILAGNTRQWEKTLPTFNQTIGKVVTICIALVLTGIIISQWYADTLFASSYRLARSGQYARAQMLIEQAITLNPNEPIYKDEMATTLVALAVGVFGEQNATVGGELANRALAQNDTAIKISPQNVNFWKTRTKLYYSLSTYDPKLNEGAISALEHARELSPNDPKIYYNLAILYGRQGENDKAIELLTYVITLKADYRDAYYALYIFNLEMKNAKAGRGVLEKYIQTINANDTQFLEILGKP